MAEERTDPDHVLWCLTDNVIRLGQGDPTLGKILDLGVIGCWDILVKFPDKTAEWISTKELVKYVNKVENIT